jgi:hypothetical protein
VGVDEHGRDTYRNDCRIDGINHEENAMVIQRSDTIDKQKGARKTPRARWVREGVDNSMSPWIISK